MIIKCVTEITSALIKMIIIFTTCIVMYVLTMLWFVFVFMGHHCGTRSGFSHRFESHTRATGIPGMSYKLGNMFHSGDP